MKYDPAKGLGSIDKVLLRAAASGKSPNEISAITNHVVKPAEAAVRIQEILAARDWLSDVQKRQLLIDDLFELKDVLKEKAVEFKNIDAAKPLISLLGQIDKTLSADKFDIEKAKAEINQAQAQLMLNAISLALERSFLELEKRYPTLQKSELMEVFQHAMPEVVREIESRVPAE